MYYSSVQIFLSNILNESRLIKSCESILTLGLVDTVNIIGVWEHGLDEKEQINSTKINIHRVKTISKTKSKNSKSKLLNRIYSYISLIQYIFYAYSFCKKEKPNYISCHNLVLLLPTVLIKKLTKAKLIYEPHELETERTGLNKIGKKIARITERIGIKYCDRIITVCEPITGYYSKNYKLNLGKIITIQNVPINPSIGENYVRSNILRDELKIPHNVNVYIYQGLISNGRGLECYLKTFSKLNNKHHLVVMGYGEGVSLVNEYQGLYTNIHYKSAVPIADIIKYTSSADVGLFVIPTNNISLSYRYSLPNKFFEYAIAGLHICVSDNFEYLSTIVKEDNLGEVIPTNNDALYNWIVANEDKHFVQNINSIGKRISYGWQNEELKFIDVYKFETI